MCDAVARLLALPGAQPEEGAGGEEDEVMEEAEAEEEEQQQQQQGGGGEEEPAAAAEDDAVPLSALTASEGRGAHQRLYLISTYGIGKERILKGGCVSSAGAQTGRTRAPTHPAHPPSHTQPCTSARACACTSLSASWACCGVWSSLGLTPTPCSPQTPPPLPSTSSSGASWGAPGTLHGRAGSLAS